MCFTRRIARFGMTTVSHTADCQSQPCENQTAPLPWNKATAAVAEADRDFGTCGSWPSVMFPAPQSIGTVTTSRKKGWVKSHMGNWGKPSFQLKILYGEGNPEVLAEQASSIQKAGHEVEAVLGRKGVEEALRKGKFDLVLLGATLTRDDRHHLPYIVKKANPQTRVLVTHADGGRHPQVDACMDSGRSINELLATIAVMNPKKDLARAVVAG